MVVVEPLVYIVLYWNENPKNVCRFSETDMKNYQKTTSYKAKASKAKKGRHGWGRIPTETWASILWVQMEKKLQKWFTYYTQYNTNVSGSNYF